MKILLINNYDSFVYNLYHLIKGVASDSCIDVKFNDEVDVKQASCYDRIIISPGPGIPSEAGNLLQIISSLYSKIPMLGVCLGHQAIGEVFGAQIYCMEKPLHGVKSTINIIDNSILFQDFPPQISVGRYHSWLISNTNFPSRLKITAIDQDGNIMAFSHRQYDVHGVQFHPESIMTPLGHNILANFLCTGSI